MEGYLLFMLFLKVGSLRRPRPTRGAGERERRRRRPVAFHYAPALITRQGRSAKRSGPQRGFVVSRGGQSGGVTRFFFLIKVTTPELVQLHQACRDVVNLKI